MSAALQHTPDRFVLLPFRRGEKDIPDWSLCSKYIATNHSSNNTTTVDDAIKSMAAYHNTIAKTCNLADTKRTPNESFINHTLMPYCQLVGQAQSHLPLHSGLVSKNLKFLWRDSFDDSAKYESNNSNSELVSCTYNLAASYVYVGTTRAHTGSTEEIKEAFKNFQSAAGYYQMVESLLDRLPSDQLTKGDMKLDSLTMLTRVCLAQAHHCGYLKAEEAMKGKHEMLAKIAAEGAKQYEETLSAFRSSVWLAKRSDAAKEVDAHLSASTCIFNARAHLHLAVKSEADGEMGIAIAHYQQAKQHLSKLPRMPTQPLTTWVNSIVNSVNTAHDDAEKANNSVYYSRVPREVPPPVGLPRPMGAPTEHPSFVRFVSRRGSDPFFGIIPAHISNIAMQWREKQRSLVNACTNNAAHCRKRTQEKLQQLGVAAAIQTMSGEMAGRGRVPESLRSRILALREGNSDGSSSSVTDVLVNKVNACNELYNVAENKLKEVAAELEKEQKMDAGYLEAYGEKMWRAVFPVCSQTPDYCSIMSAVDEHRKGLQQWFIAPFADATKTMETNLRDVARLDWPIADLDALMPFVETKEARQQSSSVMAIISKLKDLMEEKERIEKDQSIEQEKLLTRLESDDVVFSISSVEPRQREAMLASGSKDISDSIQLVETKLREEKELLPRAEKLMEELCTLQSTDPVANEIQKVSNGLENAFSINEELNKEFGSIIQYATKAVDNIDSTLSNAKSYTMSRHLSAQEIQSRLDAQIAAKMSEMQDAERQMEESRRRQAELQQQISSMQQDVPPGYRPPSATASVTSAPQSYAAMQQTAAPAYQPPSAGGSVTNMPPVSTVPASHVSTASSTLPPPSYDELNNFSPMPTAGAVSLPSISPAHPAPSYPSYHPPPL